MSIVSDKKYLSQLKYSLNVYTDDKGMLRLKGRLKNSDMKFESKFPIFLSQKSRLAELIILDCHAIVKHNKVRDTLTELRASYWVPQGRRTVSRVIKDCVLCNMMESESFKKLPMAALPSFRVNADFAFSSTGVDYLCPLLVQDIFSDSDEMYKVHVVLYTCASSRAVALDLVTDALCIAFVCSLKRFIPRHGVPRLFISDNAGCFTGPELTSFLHQINSVWKFILSSSPWWGGFWERLVQSTKRCLRKILGKSKLNYEELETIIVEIEGVLNSRPLCYVYDDPSVDVLTPSHLMVGRRLLSSFHDDVEPECVDFTTSSLSRRSKFMNEILEHFWKRWRHEYLTELREYHNCRNKTPSKQVRLGEVVLVAEDKIPRNRWRTAVVTELYPSADNVVRGCKLRTLTKGNKTSYIDRPVNKLYPLEIVSTEIEDKPSTPAVVPAKNASTDSTSSSQERQNNRPRRQAAQRGIEKRRNEDQS